MSFEAEDIDAFASIAIPELPSARGASSVANPPPPPAIEPVKELVRNNAGAISRTSSPLKPPPPA